MAVCPVCGWEGADELSVCPSCGFKFQGGTVQFKAVPGTLNEKPSESTKKPRLTIKYGKSEGLSFELSKTVMTLGRDPKCDILLSDMTVSRIHAEIEHNRDAWIIRDMKSFNGTWLNNKAIEIVSLRDGDIIQIGSFILQFHE